jgi:hypothetical protein
LSRRETRCWRAGGFLASASNRDGRVAFVELESQASAALVDAGRALVGRAHGLPSPETHRALGQDTWFVTPAKNALT